MIAAAAAHGTVDVFSANYQDYQGADNWASAENANSAVRQWVWGITPLCSLFANNDSLFRFPANTGYVAGGDIYNPSLISCGSAGHAPT